MGVRVATHGNLAAFQTVADDVSDRRNLDVVLGGEFFQVRHAGHGAVVAHDLADHGRRFEARQAGQVHAALGLAGARQHAPGFGPERKDMAGRNDILGPGVVRHGGLDGGGAVSGGNAGGNALAGLNGNREIGSETRTVALGHQRQLQAVGQFRGHGQADQAAPETGHEIDGFRRDVFGGHGQVALVLAVLIVHQNDHFALPDVGNGFFNAAQRHDYILSKVTVVIGIWLRQR